MNVFTQINDLKTCGCVATIGFFDGVHLGHRFLLNELMQLARKENKQTMVITFDEHPQRVLKKGYMPPLLTTKDDKIKLLSEIGIDNCLMLNFTEELANYTAHTFFKSILSEKLHIHSLLIGYDHRFGKNRSETFEDYQRYGQEMGITVVQASSFSEKDRHVSSSEIRRQLEQGNISTANEILGYRYNLTGTVVSGKKIGATIGFPTANLSLSEMQKLIPAVGVYAALVEVDNTTYKGMLNIGWRPTIGLPDEKNIEVHLLDFEADIYGKNIRIAFEQKIRDEIKFTNLDELTSQLQKDREFVRNLKF